jgi:hypothetical protein
MDFTGVVAKYGESPVRIALAIVLRRIREIIASHVSRAIDGVLTIDLGELQMDVESVACVLEGSPFSIEEKCILIKKAWELV